MINQVPAARLRAERLARNAATASMAAPASTDRTPATVPGANTVTCQPRAIARSRGSEVIAPMPTPTTPAAKSANPILNNIDYRERLRSAVQLLAIAKCAVAAFKRAPWPCDEARTPKHREPALFYGAYVSSQTESPTSNRADDR